MSNPSDPWNDSTLSTLEGWGMFNGYTKKSGEVVAEIQRNDEDAILPNDDAAIAFVSAAAEAGHPYHQKAIAAHRLWEKESKK